jgi:MinD-like ATPase involved in chromosome partitioning or flagellar assembly
LADHDLDRGAAAGTGEDDALADGPGQHGQPAQDEFRRADFGRADVGRTDVERTGPPRLFGQQPPFETRAGLASPSPYPSPQTELPDAFAPGVAEGLHTGGSAADGAVTVGDDAGDPYGPPDDYDTADAYGPVDDYDTAGDYSPPGWHGAANPYAPAGYGTSGESAGADADYDAGDEYGPPDGYAGPGDGSPLSLILNSAGPPGQFGSLAPPAANSGPTDGSRVAAGFSPAAAPSEPDAGPAELGTAMPGTAMPGTAMPGSAAWPGWTLPDAETAPAPKKDPDPEKDPAPEKDPDPEPRAGRGSLAPPSAAPLPPSASPRTVTADSLTADLLLPGRHKAPAGGWRRAIFEVTGGLVRAPESAAERRRLELTARARTPVSGGHHRVAVLSLKGGVGKTTTTVGLGATLASLRGDRVIAVDANPDRGTLSDKLRLETSATVRDLLNERDQIQRYADVRAYTTQAASRLEVLASDRDPTVSVAFSERDYSDVIQVLEHYYSICVTDCGTGLLHSAMTGVLRLADQIAVVSSPSVDGARSASATLDWLQAHGYGDLVRRAVVVLAVIRPRSKSAVDLVRLEQHFAARCRAVVRIPYDAHLDEGAEVELGRLNTATADAFLMLAAEIGDGFARPPGTAR